MEFQKTVEQICNERNDEWALEIKGRIEFARDLHAQMQHIIWHVLQTFAQTGIPHVFTT
jgi:hypothetical protein